MDISLMIKAKPDEDEDLNSTNLQAPVLDNDEAQVECRKKMEAGLQAWCLADGCRVDISDNYFNNPSRSGGITIHVPVLQQLYSEKEGQPWA
ncbi:hypothetical protein BC827DRAFT_1274701 [Russula dissimulans]|nr:hypothetical protein BC827DRAFT_1274701 [Russula dissimulans]